MPPRRRGYFGFIEEDESPSPTDEEEEALSRSTFIELTVKPFEGFDREHLWETLAAEPRPERQTPETTHTSDSYTTALVLSEPLEHLYEELTDPEEI